MNLSEFSGSNGSESDRNGSDSESHAGDSVTRRESAALLAQRRQQLTDDFISGHTHVREDGAKIRRVEHEDETVEWNYSKLFGAAPSTTSDLELIRTEARLAANGTNLDNPHVPANDAVLRTALDVLEDEGLTPAWEAVTSNVGGESE